MSFGFWPQGLRNAQPRLHITVIKELSFVPVPGLLSNQGDKGSFKKKSIKVWYSKAQVPLGSAPLGVGPKKP